MRESDEIRLRHVLDAGEDIARFSHDRTREDLDADRMLSLALLKSIEIIGEAVSQVSEDVRERFPDVPWAGVVAMRNRLVHGYFDVDWDRVWHTVERDVPALLEQVERILAHQTENRDR